MTITNDLAARLKAAQDDSDRLRQALVQADRDLATTRQQYQDADHAANVWHAKARWRGGEIGRLNTEVHGLRRDLAWHVENAKAQAERIRELEAEGGRVITRSDVDAIPRLTGDALKAAREQIAQFDLPPTRADEQATD